jgi:hypothetical protein
LSDKDVAWPLVRESFQENNTIENMERIFKAAKTYESPGLLAHAVLTTDEAVKAMAHNQP